VSDISEYNLVREFDDLPRFLDLAEEDKIPDGWKEHITEKSSYLAIPATSYLTASGTSNPVYYSDPPRVYHRMWMYTNLDSQVARILGLWFDSSLGILQFLLTRLPGRGGWRKYRKYSQQRFVCPDVSSLNAAEVEELESCFDEFAHVEAPSLVEQMTLNADSEQLTNNDLTHLTMHFEGLDQKLGEGFAARR
jgi:hypothetical protein